MIPGIDVSHYQGSIDWAKVKAAGIRFVYVKASQGADFTDPRLFANVAGAAAAGIPIGLYHVFVANLGNAQLSKWQEIYASADSQLPPWIDIEPGAVTEETAPQALEFLRAMKSNSGTKPRNPGKPCVYCSPMTAQSDLSDPEFRTYPLAIAHYTDAPSPNTVLWSGWEFWQHSCSGTVDGILGAVDLDRFNADESDFQKLLGLPVTSPQRAETPVQRETKDNPPA
jgi:lysozyme